LKRHQTRRLGSVHVLRQHHGMESENMRNALEIAAFFGYEQVADPLLDREADVNLPSTYDRCAPYAASRQGHTHIVKLLLNHDANVNVNL
jgi:ankyrin repeat protein